jgi:hypothetical protein
MLRLIGFIAVVWILIHYGIIQAAAWWAAVGLMWIAAVL